MPFQAVIRKKRKIISNIPVNKEPMQNADEWFGYARFKLTMINREADKEKIGYLFLSVIT